MINKSKNGEEMNAFTRLIRNKDSRILASTYSVQVGNTAINSPNFLFAFFWGHLELFLRPVPAFVGAWVRFKNIFGTY